MTSPYRTPRYPGAPHPTPRSTQTGLLRRPIYNPYDKFTQPEFDAWIGDITGALKRALGREDELPTTTRIQPLAPAEESVEDSFAAVKARRVAKGKERARDDDSAEGAYAGEASQHQGGCEEPYDSEEHSSGESEEEARQAGLSTEPEVIDLLSDDDDAEEQAQVDAEGSEEEQSEEDVADVDEAEGSEDCSDDAQESPRARPVTGSHQTTYDITEILDSDEEPEETEAEDERRVIPARFQRKPNSVADKVSDEDGEDGLGVPDEEQAEEEEDPFPPREAEKEPVDIDDPWRGPTTYAEDFYSGGDIPEGEIEGADPHALPADEDELIADEPVHAPDLPDPWEGPRAFAEDFYAGGDALPEGATPSHLTPKDEGELVIPGITSVDQEVHATANKLSEQAEVNVDDLYADVDGQAAERMSEAVQYDDDSEASEDEERPPSPPSATLRTHVDWNWPPAFPGRVATRPGHVESAEQEIFEISDDEDEAPTGSYVGQPGQSAEQDAEAVSQPLHNIDDTSGLYSNFDDIYSMGDEGESFESQTSFEPISPPGVDFGDLPPSQPSFTDLGTNGDVQELNGAEMPQSLESLLRDVADAAARELGIPVNGAAANPSADGGVPVERPEHPRFFVGIEEVTDGEDEGRPAKSKAAEQFIPEPEPQQEAVRMSDEVLVIEVQDDEDDIRSSVPVEDDIEITSVHSDVAASPAEYVVEEAKTEGRRTEEPEVPVDESHAEDAPAKLPENNGAVSDVPEDLPAAPSPSSPEFAVEPVPMYEEGGVAPAVPTTLERTLSSSHFPPPVSANPNVHDPASLTPSPASPASPASPEIQVQSSSPASVPERALHDATELPANAALHPVFRKLATAKHSPSGLFTPLTNESSPSESVSPERQSSVGPVVQADEVQGMVGETQVQGEEEQVQAEETSILNNEPSEAEAQIEDQPAEVVAEELESSGPSGDIEVEKPEAPEEAAAPVGEVAGPSEEPAKAYNASPLSQEVLLTEEVEEHKETGDAVDGAEVAMLDATGPEKVVTNGHVAHHHRPSPATDLDQDAEGDSDPEYVLSRGTTQPEDLEEPADMAAVREATKALQAAQAAAEEAEAEGAEVATDAPLSADDLERQSPAPDVAPADEQQPAADVHAGQRSSPVEGSLEDEAKDEVRPLKRKRASPPPSRIPRLTRSRTSEAEHNGTKVDVAKAVAQPKRTKRKGKRRANAETDEDDSVSVAHSHTSESTSGGSSIAAQKMLVPDSRGTSRASSVVSTAPSGYSALSQVSPTIDRVLPANGHHDPPPLFIHNHGIMHHHHGRPTAPVVPVIPQRQPSEPPARQGRVSRRPSAEPGPSTQPGPSKASATHTTSSPVTRSNCRFHTISIPKEENGPRVLFAVPGCAFSDAELMKEERIEDQGFVKPEDVTRVIRDVESLNISPSLIGVLRQLVGVDLLREQEVFYIPRPGDGVVLNHKGKHHRSKPKQRESISARTRTHGAASRAKASSSMAPPSFASVSTSGESASHKGKLPRKASGSVATSTSFSGSELSELEDEEAPPAKRAKEDHPTASVRSQSTERRPDADGHVPTETQPEGTAPPQLASQSPDAPSPAMDEGANTSKIPRARLQIRRSRRLGVDAAAYKPEAAESDGSDPEEDAGTRKKRRRGPKKGLKRTRTEEDGEAPAEGTGGKLKRRRVRAATANGDKAVPNAGDAAP